MVRSHSAIRRRFAGRCGINLVCFRHGNICAIGLLKTESPGRSNISALYGCKCLVICWSFQVFGAFDVPNFGCRTLKRRLRHDYSSWSIVMSTPHLSTEPKVVRAFNLFSWYGSKLIIWIIECRKLFTIVLYMRTMVRFHMAPSSSAGRSIW